MYTLWDEHQNLTNPPIHHSLKFYHFFLMRTSLILFSEQMSMLQPNSINYITLSIRSLELSYGHNGVSLEYSFLAPLPPTPSNHHSPFPWVQHFSIISEITQCFPLCIWFISLSIMPSWFTNIFTMQCLSMTSVLLSVTSISFRHLPYFMSGETVTTVSMSWQSHGTGSK